jgi:hypothetical protein
MTLLELQRAVARAVMQPLTASQNMQRRAPSGGSMNRYAARIIKPNDRLTSFERLEIYNKQYWFRVLDSMIDDFPGLRAVLGERRFDAMAKAYLVAHPSRSFTLRNLPSQFVPWLRKNPKWAGKNRQLALDIARLEWADIEAFDGKAEPPLQQQDLAGSGGTNPAASAKLKLTLQPYIRLLDLHYPVDDLLLEVRKDEEDTDFASNAFTERRKRKRVRAVAKLETSEIFLAVHRIENSVYFRRLGREEFAILSALRDGKALGAAIEFAFRKSALPAAERAAKAREWFATWAALGWFCRPAKKHPRR